MELRSSIEFFSRLHRHRPCAASSAAASWGSRNGVPKRLRLAPLQAPAEKRTAARDGGEDRVWLRTATSGALGVSVDHPCQPERQSETTAPERQAPLFCMLPSVSPGPHIVARPAVGRGMTPCSTGSWSRVAQRQTIGQTCSIVHTRTVRMLVERARAAIASSFATEAQCAARDDDKNKFRCGHEPHVVSVDTQHGSNQGTRYLRKLRREAPEGRAARHLDGLRRHPRAALGPGAWGPVPCRVSVGI